MPALAVPQKDIARARAGYITDQLLERLRDIAHDANAGETNEDAAQLFLICAPGVCEELLDYRRRAREGCELDVTNVVPLRGDS